MNKKLLFGIMSLAALTACTSNDFESQEVAQEESPVKFEVINNAETRAEMNGNTIVWNAEDGDLFTLYHGGAALNDYENATYKANANPEGTATLTTPSMIKQGFAIMVWPVDTTFRIQNGTALSLVIPANQTKDIENHIPYVSDRISIGAYSAYSTTPAPGSAYNTAGKDRKYPVYMRPMASQLTIKADYVGSDDKIAELYEGGTDGLTGDDAINPISVTSVELLTDAGGTELFTTEVPLKWSAANANWGAAGTSPLYHNWTGVTDFNEAGIVAGGQTARLTTKCLTGNSSSKFLLLPQKVAIAGGLDKGAVLVNTIYGKVLVAKQADWAASKYTNAEYNKAWYRYVSAAVAAPTVEENASTPGTGEYAGKHKVVAKDLALGMQQTINDITTRTASSGIVKTERVGVATTRFVEVRLEHLDMSDLHVTSDKQLRDAARVWKKLGLDDVTVHLDGNSSNHFVITQKTIQTINEINAASGAKSFKVTPCNTPGEVCNEIIITGGDKIQDLTFITDKDKTADVVLSTGFTWKWNGTIKVHETATDNTGIASIINRGTLENAEDKVLNIVENDGVPTPINLKVKNDVPGEWNITGGRIRVQNQVENLGKVTISKGAQLIEDGAKHGAAAVFTNNALTLENRFIGGSGQRIGKVINNGVFATTASGVINNYSLIEHADKDAKTYITSNEIGTGFAAAFNATTNKIGRINLPYSNREEDNISISAGASEGFVSVTVDGEVTGALNADVVGARVNYVIVKSGINSISNLPGTIKYLEVDMTDKSEIAWTVTGTKTFDGLMVLTDINIKLNTTIHVNKATYLGADMYVGGLFQYDNGGVWTKVDDGTNPAPNAFWDGYYGTTHDKVPTQYITF